MRRFSLTLGAFLMLAALLAPPAGAQPSHALRSLRRALRQGMAQIGGASGAYVVDLTTGATLFSDAPRAGRIPASVQKLYTTTTALLRFGPQARLATSVLGTGWRGHAGVWHGTLYLRGGGDPTFGSASFDRAAYRGAGATVQRLVANLVHQESITGLQGSIVADASYFDSRRSTVESGYQPDSYMEGELSALAFDRGFANFSGTVYQAHPVRYAAQQFAAALQQAGVGLRSGTRVRTGRTPSQARLLGVVRSPRMAKLIHLTNTPSDNFMAEMLLKNLGARFGAGGTTAAGAAVVHAEMASQFGIPPRFDDGSGLSYDDSTSPRQVVTLLRAMAPNPIFVRSLAIGGQTGTLKDEMKGTAAKRNCRGKTGTLSDVANLSGYCHARDGHTLVFAFLANRISDTEYVHSVEANDMAAALARYNG